MKSNMIKPSEPGRESGRKVKHLAKTSPRDWNTNFDNRHLSAIQRRQQALINTSPRVTGQGNVQGIIDRYRANNHPFAPPDENSVQKSTTPSIGDSKWSAIRTIQNEAAKGVQGQGETLPHFCRVQQAFGGHDLSRVQAHTDARAGTAASTMGAKAYAVGDKVAFGQKSPSLFTVAHEAAHVVQQRHGIQLPDGVGAAGDRYEQEADQVAIQVTQGQSAGPLLQKYSKNKRPLSKTVQGLTGFEVELHIPTYGEASAERSPRFLKDDSSDGEGLSLGEKKQIQNFLGGGLIYGLNYGTESHGYFEISSDHGGGFRTPHASLITKLSAQGYIEADYIGRSMSNMEYITPPIEERQVGTDDKVAAIAAALKTHSTDAGGKAKDDANTSLIAPVAHLFTGIPVSALKKMTSKDTTGISGAIDEVKTAVNPRLYYQTTTGVLPSEIPGLFTAMATEVKNKAGGFDDLTPKGKAIFGLMKGAVKLAREAMPGVKKIVTDATPTEYLSIQGWMTLLVQYIFGSALEQSDFLREGSTDKNMVVFLSKTSLEKTMAALPPKVRPAASKATENGKKWIKVFLDLVKECEANDIVEATGLTKKVKAKEFIGETRAWLSSILSGVNPGGSGTGRPLELDEQSKGALDLKAREEAIPLEDRHMDQRLTDFSPSKVDEVIKGEWAKAVARRRQSTTTPETATSSQHESEKQKLDKAKIGVETWMKLAKQKYRLEKGVISGFNLEKIDAELDHDVFNDISDVQYTEKLDILKAKIITACNAAQNTKNLETLKWIKVIYRDIEYSWKDDNEYKPELHGTAPNSYVKIAKKWVKAVDKGGYLKYLKPDAEDLPGNWQKIERSVGGVETYLGTDGAWKA